MITHYQILNIDPDATSDQIKRAYRTRAKVMHPDHGGNERDFQLLNDAYCTLSDPYSRAAYDSRLGFYAHEQQAAARAASQAASWAASQTTSRAASQMRRETEEVAARRKAAATKEKPFPVHLFRMILFIIFVIYVVRECS